MFQPSPSLPRPRGRNLATEVEERSHAARLPARRPAFHSHLVDRHARGIAPGRPQGGDRLATLYARGRPDIQDRDGTGTVIQAIHDLFPWLRHLFADSVYNGPNLREALAKFGDWTMEIVTRAAGVAGFQLLPRRWVVERTLAWLNRNRRLAKDFETPIASATAWIYIASTQLLIRRLADA